MTTPLAPKSTEQTDPSISYRKAFYVGAAAAGIGCLGPVSIFGYIGAAAAGALAGVVIDATRSIGQRLAAPYYAKVTHHLTGPFAFDEYVDNDSKIVDQAFASIQSHPVYLFLMENNHVKGTFSPKSFINMIGNRRRGKGEITALLNLIHQDPDRSWQDLLSSVKAKDVFYYQMLHVLKFKIDFSKAQLIVMNTTAMYGPGSSDIVRQIGEREAQIEALTLQSQELASELYPYRVINGGISTHSLEYYFKQLLPADHEQKMILGCLTILSPIEASADEKYYHLQCSRSLWIHEGSYTVPEQCPNLPAENRDSVSAFTGRSIFFQYREGLFRLYDPKEGFFEFDKEEDFFDTIRAIKGSQSAQFSLYLPKSGNS